jgi:predicted dienelactone hydrolase
MFMSSNPLGGSRARTIAFALLFVVTACTRAEAQVGEHAQKIDFQGEATPATIWYPTAAVAKPVAAGPFMTRVVMDAEPSPGRHPLVLLSHGSGGDPLSYETLAEALVQAGFIVAGVEHLGDSLSDGSRFGTPELFNRRPRQTSALLDALLADPQWAPLIDPSRIGALGHSAGAYTVLALGGAVPDLQALVQHCHDDYAADGFCHYRGIPDTVYARVPPSPMPMSGLADPRIRAVAALAPIGVIFEPASLKAMTVPVWLGTGQLDEVVPERYHAQPLVAIWGARVQWHSFAGAGHFSFISPVLPAWKERLGEVASDPAGFDRDAFQGELSRDLVAFFEGALGK